MPTRAPVTFLFDVDNTLLDNDRITEELHSFLVREVGGGRAAAYFERFEELRTELGYADYLGALQRYRIAHPRDPHLLAVSSFLIDYPFADRLLPGALDVLAKASRAGPTVILTDGDVVFQPHKIRRSGLHDAVHGRVLIYIHKERELADVERRYPSDHYVLIDDKVRILTAIKQVWTDRLTTIFPRQGHYATDPNVTTYPAPDHTIEHIADLLTWLENAPHFVV